MSYKELKEVVFNTDPSELTYHFSKNGLFIGAKLISVEKYYGNAGIKLNFKSGSVHVWKDNLITLCRRPNNLIIDCEICFRLYNEEDDEIGYLYMK